MKNNIGIIISNVGTPSHPNKKSVKKYLSEFLSDKRVIDISRFFWIPYLHLYFLPLKSYKSVNLYKKIWEKDGSPLMINSLNQRNYLINKFPNFKIELGMRYGDPSICVAIKKMIKIYNVNKLIILPMYPQYSCTTTASVLDSVCEVIKKYRNIPSIIFIRDYADNINYINAITNSIKKSFNKNGIPEMLIMSFHGIPKKYIKDGDDYLKRCNVTKKLVLSKLNFSRKKVIMSFQSKFGNIPWITPITSEVISFLPKKGIKNIQVICPGFSSDCLETLEEIKIQNKKIFKDNGGKKFHYIPALNYSKIHIECLANIIRTHLK
ncbi:hemH [Wigglesworthia glossinidia endosymbiont of Glossina brevipalpis]|uniref:Ferrochelatase n=1 Tax=Wigglesworthia glossinidia brevipalpis TaxID=36870 RepID=HEMH_WIGBR|nr:RecName: Full=Ferrochelatase; AltName: Full=Heme synthase; AltName: Full=Protoheme ferro-lyase [Wigglesworthia glossinidia endosymbiont of Glossina brevipalpis]BAC24675.1 hemH [Wigglesworthia glossinidia endosymbiont of Glossina brevipalpis]